MWRDFLIAWYPDVRLTPLSDPLPLITPTHLPDWTKLFLSQCQTLFIASTPYHPPSDPLIMIIKFCIAIWSMTPFIFF